MLVDPESGRVTPWCDRYRLERFKGCNDLIFGAGGEMYFTDQGQTGHQDASGRVFRLGPDGRLDCLIDTIPSPNGIVVDRAGKIVYVAVHRANPVCRMTSMAAGGASKGGTFRPLS